MKVINHAFIMAAGRGIRLKPLTNSLPKGMMPYKNTTLISNGISKLKKLQSFMLFVTGEHLAGPGLEKIQADNFLSY